VSKKPKQPWPKGPYTIGRIGEVVRILDANGNDVMCDPEGIARLVECANACADMHFPANAIPAMKAWAERTEQLRRDAWSRAQQLQAIVDATERAA
jgi:hypothetical protein